MGLFKTIFGKRAGAISPPTQAAPSLINQRDIESLVNFIDELAQIGLDEGFMATEPGGAYDSQRRHIRTREIGEAIGEIAKRGGVLSSNGTPITKPTDLMGIALRKVTLEMRHHPNYTSLRYAWDGIAGWYP